MTAKTLKFLAVAVSLLVAPPAAAQTTPQAVDPEKLAAAKAYMEITDMQAMVKKMIPGLVSAIATQLQKQGAADEGVKYFQTRFMERMFIGHWDEFEAAVQSLLLKHFTTEELKALATFYGSTLGRSIMAKFPDYTVQTQVAIGGWMRKHAAAELQAALEDAQKKGYKIKPPKR